MDVYFKSQITRIVILGRGILPNNFITITIVLLTLDTNRGGVAGRAHPFPLQFLRYLVGGAPLKVEESFTCGDDPTTYSGVGVELDKMFSLLPQVTSTMIIRTSYIRI